ncbi:hypothetical protein C8F01DRAFT_1261986 [Mycena amicta]|nr:hypothetical protein C8F01DRAFT_1261986 [Mycena amicta]
MSSQKLFQPIRIGDIELAHRVVFAPSTRFRGDANHVPLPHVAEYYEQRASSMGSLLVTEGVFPSARAGGLPHVPGIWSDEQIDAWKEVTRRVHAQGSYIFLQIWVLGRAASPEYLAAQNLPYVSASDVPLVADFVPYVPMAASDVPKGEYPPPRPLTVEEIAEYVDIYATSASNAVHKAGFDGVEIHSANGYLLNQFLHDGCNTRTDEYGGSVENRARFSLEVVAAVVMAVGQKKTGFRLSPWSDYQGMYQADPRPTYSYLVTQLRDRFPDLAYLSLVEAHGFRFSAENPASELASVNEGKSNDFLREIWGERPLISTGGYTRESALAAAEKGDIVGFARSFIANPDLPYRLLHDIKLTAPNRAFYYVMGSTDPKGYTDYAFAEEVAVLA